jgi:hypothetical protein
VDETGWKFGLEVLHGVGPATLLEGSKVLPQQEVSTPSTLFQDEPLTKAVYGLGSGSHIRRWR